MEDITRRFGCGEGSNLTMREFSLDSGIPIIVGSISEAEALSKCGIIAFYVGDVKSIGLGLTLVDHSALAKVASDLVIAHSQIDQMLRAIEALQDMVIGFKKSH